MNSCETKKQAHAHMFDAPMRCELNVESLSSHLRYSFRARSLRYHWYFYVFFVKKLKCIYESRHKHVQISRIKYTDTPECGKKEERDCKGIT